MSQFDGRWDLAVGEGNSSYPSWVEITGNGGQFVGQVGSARPLREVSSSGEVLRWSLPPQWEGRKDDLIFTGTLEGENLKGTTTLNDGTPSSWSGVRAPEFPAVVDAQFGEAIELANNLDLWKPRSPAMTNNWGISAEGLDNSAVGSDLVTLETFTDFRLIAEYKYPENSNSGIYLRGRYEFQILDDLGIAPHVGGSGAIYGFLAPNVNAVKPFGEWNIAEITLIGRTVTVVLNGETVLDRREIPGITGGALDSAEGEPGPLFVQGDHGPVVFRRFSLHPSVG